MRLVVLEFEQVIAHTAPLRAAALEATCRALALPAPTATARALAATATPDELAAELAAVHAPADDAFAALAALHLARAMQAQVDGGVRLRDGVTSFLEGCATEGRVGIVSRAPRAVVAPLLALSGLEAAIRFVWCADDRAAAGAAAVERAIAEHGRQASAVAVIADRDDWRDAGARAGARVVAVPWAPPEVTTGASWDSFRGRVPSDLDGPP